jgi:hypothetical protein
MGQVVNLRTSRRRAMRQQVAEKALKNGRSKAERNVEIRRSAKASRDLDRHHLETEIVHEITGRKAVDRDCRT